MHEAWARALGGDTTKVISVYTSLFLENAFEVSPSPSSTLFDLPYQPTLDAR